MRWNSTGSSGHDRYGDIELGGYELGSGYLLMNGVAPSISHAMGS